MVAASLVAVAATTMVAEATVVSGSFYCFCSAVTDWDSVVPAPAVAADAVAAHHGTMDVEAVTTAVAANSLGNGLGGIFGCPSCHESNPALTETLKLFLPYFPLHIQNLIRLYLKLLEFMHTFEMIQNMINHMDEYQALFKMFEGMGRENGSPKSTPSSSNPLQNISSFFANGELSMPDLSSMQKMMEGSDLIDEFTYVEEPSGADGHGS